MSAERNAPPTVTVKYLRPMLWGIRQELLALAEVAAPEDAEAAETMRAVAEGPLADIGLVWEEMVNG